jgi:hypothetical protein
MKPGPITARKIKALDLISLKRDCRPSGCCKLFRIEFRGHSLATKRPHAPDSIETEAPGAWTNVPAETFSLVCGRNGQMCLFLELYVARRGTA